MAITDLVNEHFEAKRWGIIQYLQHGMVDPGRGIIAPLEIRNQGYGDDMQQIYFLASYLLDQGMEISDMELVRWFVDMDIVGKKQIRIPIPGLGWADPEGNHVFCPAPFVRFDDQHPEPQFEPDTERSIVDLITEMQSRCKEIRLESEGQEADALVYCPAFFPNTLFWDSETHTLATGIVGTNIQPGLYKLYFELSRYLWRENTIAVERQFGFNADINIASLYQIQLAISCLDPMAGLEYLVARNRTTDVAGAGMVLEDGQNEVIEKHLPTFKMLIGNIMAFPNKQQRSLFRKISEGNTRFEACRP